MPFLYFPPSIFFLAPPLPSTARPVPPFPHYSHTRLLILLTHQVLIIIICKLIIQIIILLDIRQLVNKMSQFQIFYLKLKSQTASFRKKTQNTPFQKGTHPFNGVYAAFCNYEGVRPLIEGWILFLNMHPFIDWTSCSWLQILIHSPIDWTSLLKKGILEFFFKWNILGL